MIYGIIGDTGEGMTHRMAYFVWQSHCRGYKIYSNAHVNLSRLGIPFDVINNLEDIEQIGRLQKKKRAFILDEGMDFPKELKEVG